MEWSTRTRHLYNERYYEYGRKTNYSWYDDYRWEPERSRGEAEAFVRTMGVSPLDRCVDFGAAKGFFVRGMIETGFNCFGLEISDYAREHADQAVAARIFDPQTAPLQTYDFGFCKDVLEHVPYEDIDRVLEYMASICGRWLLVIPMADGDQYRIPEYELETTHVIREAEDWWIARVNQFLKTRIVAHWVRGIKDKWFAECRDGNLVLVTEPNREQ